MHPHVRSKMAHTLMITKMHRKRGGYHGDGTFALLKPLISSYWHITWRTRCSLYGINYYVCRNIFKINFPTGDPGGRAVKGEGLRPISWWDRGFDARCGHGHLCLASVVCYQTEVSVVGWSLIQRSTTICGVRVWSGKPQPEKAWAYEGC